MRAGTLERLIVVAGLAICLASPVGALTIDGPLTQAEIQALNDVGATYGPPAPINFVDGPITIPSGSSATLFGGNKPGVKNVGSVVFVLSGMQAGFLSGDSVSFLLTAGADSALVTLGVTDFYTTAGCGFPSSIDGIGNGSVNGIKFPDASHAAAMVDLSVFGSFSEGDIVGSAFIVTPIDLRVDIFGVDMDGRLIIDNTPNSHSLGVFKGYRPPTKMPDGGVTAMALGVALMALGMVGRKLRAL